VVVVVIKLEGYQGKEITIEELVVQYYKDPDKYFEVIINVKPRSSNCLPAPAPNIIDISGLGFMPINTIEILKI
jgi:hypothetical protein